LTKKTFNQMLLGHQEKENLDEKDRKMEVYMATSSSALSSGQNTSFDPYAYAERLKAQSDRVIDAAIPTTQTVAKVAAEYGIRIGAEAGKVAAVAAIQNRQGTGAGLVSAPLVSSAIDSAKDACIQASPPVVDASVDASCNVSRYGIHTSVDSSASSADCSLKLGKGITSQSPAVAAQ
jgi:hypothetical protein